MPEKLQTAYKTIMTDHLPTRLTITLDGNVWSDQHQGMIVANPQTIVYEKVTWNVSDGVDTTNAGLRYGENPGQEAALFRPVNGNLVVGKVETIKPGRWLASDAELLQSGKHPGKTNITDADNALNILRYFTDQPVVAIMKHNNPCGVAIGDTLQAAYQKANMADRIAAFGGTIALNRAVDVETATAIAENYSEVVVAPEFEEGVMAIFATKKNLRVMRISAIAKLQEWVGSPMLDFKSLIDGGLILQTSYVPKVKTLDDVKDLPLGYHEHQGRAFQIQRAPTKEELKDMWFGWLVESGITSNSVIYVKDGVTIGIGTGEQDRVGVAEIARDKAYTKLKDRLCFAETGKSYNEVMKESENGNNNSDELLDSIDNRVLACFGNLEGAIMVSDAFFPKRDGVDVGLREGVRAIIQPGGSISDYEVIEACNKANATMVFTGQRSFKH